MPQVKTRPNVTKPLIKTDIAGDINQKYKQYPEFKQMYG
jgi:hypothetical protein